MLRRIACGALICAIAALVGGCGDESTTPNTPTPIEFTETFTGTLNAASGSTHAFGTITGGKVTATLTTVGPDATKNVGFSLGTFNATLNICTIVLDNPAALQAAVFTATASTGGNYCVRLYDNGNVTTDAVPYTYTITVVHP
jgi:hypothetical protein